MLSNQSSQVQDAEPKFPTVRFNADDPERKFSTEMFQAKVLKRKHPLESVGARWQSTRWQLRTRWHPLALAVGTCWDFMHGGQPVS